jgi:hypothetical protein
MANALRCVLNRTSSSTRIMPPPRSVRSRLGEYRVMRVAAAYLLDVRATQR